MDPSSASKKSSKPTPILGEVLLEHECNDSPFFHLDQLMNIPNLKTCDRCHRQGNLLCYNCEGVYYCSKRCQKLNWPEHKTLCQSTRKYLDTSKEMKQNYHSFISYCQERGKTSSRETYETALDAGIDAVYKPLGLLGKCYTVLDTRHSLREAILNLLLALRIDRQDRSHYCESIPFLLISLQQDQLAYDYIKSMILYQQQFQETMASLIETNQTKPMKQRQTKQQLIYKAMKSTPFLKCWQSDLTEDILVIENPHQVLLSHLIAYFMIKLRMLITIRNEERLYYLIFAINTADAASSSSTSHSRRSPSPSWPIAKLSPLLHDPDKRVMRLIKSYLIGPSTTDIRRNRFIDKRPMEDLQHQLTELMELAALHNGFIWQALLHVKELLEDPTPSPSNYEPGSIEECQFIGLNGGLAFSYNVECGQNIEEVVDEMDQQQQHDDDEVAVYYY